LKREEEEQYRKTFLFFYIMLRVFLLIALLSTMRGSSLRRSRRSVMTDRGHTEEKCLGISKLVAKKETNFFKMSVPRVLVKKISRVVMEGSCCVTIYSRVNYQGKSHSIQKPGEFLTRVSKAKSVLLRKC
jgi:hypothetical protein